MTDNKQKSGVYEILNITNGKRYVGSAVNLPRRKNDHWRRLRGNHHRNQYLQNAWNKYNEEALEFEVLEHLEPEILVSFEQWWMNMLQPEYNMCPVAGNSLGYTHTDEALANMSAAQKGKTLSEDHRAKISKSLKGNKNALGYPSRNKGKKLGPMSEEHKKKISAALIGNTNGAKTR